MKTKILSLVIILSALSTTYCMSAVVKETRTVGSFTKISASGGVDVYFTQSNSQKIEIEADEDLIKDIKTRVESGKLIIEREKKNLSWGNNKKSMKVYVSAPAIEEVNISGGVDFYCEELKCNSGFKLNASGGADADITKLLVSKSTEILTSGGADIEIKNMETKDCILSASGGGDIDANIQASGNIEMNASGGADIKVSGQAKQVNANASGGSDINIRNLKYENIQSNKSGGSDIYK